MKMHFTRRFSYIVSVALCILCCCIFGSGAWATYAVRISDLSNTPLPPNPIKVWGKVTSVSPVRLFDGCAEITVTGITPSLNEFLILTGDYSGGVLTVGTPPEVVSVPGMPTGNQSPIVNFSETYSTTGSTCNQGHAVEYSFNWGDGTSSPWSASTSASHSWSAVGVNTVMVTARCQANTNVSATSAGVSVNVTQSPYTGEMIYISAGSFLMGNNGSEPYNFANELPQHSVSLSGYYIGKYEVTRGEYRAFMTATDRAAPYFWADHQDWGTGIFTQTDNYPVVGVTYDDAEAFCAWAGGHLPTEAQWEKAARWTGNHPNIYPWGNTLDVEKCNNPDDHNAAGGGYQRYQTAPVGSYPSGASPYGCMDMAGNVFEWVQDWYKSYPGSSEPFDHTNSYRVLRGGCWYNYDHFYRCASRSYGNPVDRGSDVGFRLAR